MLSSKLPSRARSLIQRRVGCRSGYEASANARRGTSANGCWPLRRDRVPGKRESLFGRESRPSCSYITMLDGASSFQGALQVSRAPQSYRGGVQSCFILVDLW